MRDIRNIGPPDEPGRQLEVSFVIRAQGHPSIVASHPTTIEITRDAGLTRRGDCVVAVSAQFGLNDLPSKIKEALSSDVGRGRLTIKVQDEAFTFEGRGSAGLTFTHQNEIVVRKSGFVSDRTLMVYSNRAAIDIPRRIVKLLQNPDEKVTVEISIIGEQLQHRLRPAIGVEPRL